MAALGQVFLIALDEPSWMKPIAIIAGLALALIAIPLYLYNPYVNGVAYTHQRECERTVLLNVAYKIADSWHKLRNGNAALSFAEIIAEIPDSTEIDYAGYGFTMNWEIVECDEFTVGESDKSVVLFPTVDLAKINEPWTPLMIHVSSSFTEPNDNCVLMVFPTPEIGLFALRDDELVRLLECETPADAANWLREYRESF